MSLASAKPQLVNAIKSAMDVAMTASQNREGDYNAIRTQYANNLADAFEVFVKSAQITIGPSQINITGPGGGGTNPAPVVITDVPPNSIT